MKKNILSITLFASVILCMGCKSTPTPRSAEEKTALEAKLEAKEVALMIADRILTTTTYDFKNNRTGETFPSVKDMPLDMEVKVNCKYNNWHYTNGVTHLALMELADKTGDKKYDEYVRKNMDFVFNEGNLDFFRQQYDQAMKEEGWNGVRKHSWHMIFRGKRLDDNGPMGASLIALQQKYPHEAFQQYIDQTAEHILYAEPRLEDGTIARYWPHIQTIWADDAFMAISFLCRMGQATGDMRYIDDAAHQVIKYHDYLWCPEKRLFYHYYHTDTKEHGVAHWSRANGWVFMATADLLSVMPENHPKRAEVLKLFRKQASGVIRYQGKNGLWHQLLDKEDSYEEITGTAMFTFGLAKAVKNGWLELDFIYAAEQGLKGMLTKISEKGDVTAICVGTGIKPSPTFYYNRPTQENDPMGEGPVLRALIEMMDAPKHAEIKAESQYDKIVVKK